MGSFTPIVQLITTGEKEFRAFTQHKKKKNIFGGNTAGFNESNLNFSQHKTVANSYNKNGFKSYSQLFKKGKKNKIQPI